MDLANSLLGRAPAPSPASTPDSSPLADFEDFLPSNLEVAANAPPPAARPTGSFDFITSFLAPTQPNLAAHYQAQNISWTKWYRVQDRHAPAEFVLEFFVLGVVLLAAVVHLYGASVNRKKARQWIAGVGPILEKEFALVGFGPTPPTADSVQAEGLHRALEGAVTTDTEIMRQETIANFKTYASGRQNIAAAELELRLYKRNNPLQVFGEMAVGSLFESYGFPYEAVVSALYLFDGREADMLDESAGSPPTSSKIDGFVWAICHKDMMRRFREDRYDVSLTITKDSDKLPVSLVTMSESADITEALLKPELVKLVSVLGDSFSHLLITDLPTNRPSTINAIYKTQKRIFLVVSPPSTPAEATAYNDLLQYLIRLPDFLVSNAGKIRAETLKKLKATRDREAEKLRKADEEEREADRALNRDKAKKEARDKQMRSMTAEQQRKFLEKEREQERKKQMKRSTVKA